MPSLPDPVDVANVRAGADRFHCEPYACVLSADSCRKRQVLALVHGPGGSVEHCYDCPIGKRICAQLDAPLPELRPCTAKDCRGSVAPDATGEHCPVHARTARAAQARRGGAGYKRAPRQEDS